MKCLQDNFIDLAERPTRPAGHAHAKGLTALEEFDYFSKVMTVAQGVLESICVLVARVL